jgi:hypothetical protein
MAEIAGRSIFFFPYLGGEALKGYGSRVERLILFGQILPERGVISFLCRFDQIRAGIFAFLFGQIMPERVLLVVGGIWSNLHKKH